MWDVWMDRTYSLRGVMCGVENARIGCGLHPRLTRSEIAAEAMDPETPSSFRVLTDHTRCNRYTMFLDASAAQIISLNTVFTTLLSLAYLFARM